MRELNIYILLESGIVKSLRVFKMFVTKCLSHFSEAFETLKFCEGSFFKFNAAKVGSICTKEFYDEPGPCNYRRRICLSACHVYRGSRASLRTIPGHHDVSRAIVSSLVDVFISYTHEIVLITPRRERLRTHGKLPFV